MLNEKLEKLVDKFSDGKNVILKSESFFYFDYNFNIIFTLS